MDEFLMSLDLKIAVLNKAYADAVNKLTAEDAEPQEKESAFQELRAAAAEIVATPHF